jgi:hypothetical protein
MQILHLSLRTGDYHVDGMRLYLWTADNGPTVHPPRDIYVHEQSRWNDIDREKPLIRPPELCGNPTSTVIWQQAGGTGEGN